MLKKTKIVGRNIWYNILNNPIDLIHAKIKYNSELSKFKGDTRIIDVLDYNMYVRKDDLGLSKQLLLRGKREQLATDYFIEDMEDGMTFLDIGANLGYYVLMELAYAKNSKVIAIEPNPENFKVLKKNVLLNKFDKRVELHNFACSDENGTASFFVGDHCNAGNLLGLSSDHESFTVETKRVDSVVKENIDYVRMDTEGYEFNIIKGMDSLLISKHAPKKMFIEVHPRPLKELGHTMDEFMDMMKSYGFTLKKVIYQRSSTPTIKERVMATYTNIDKFRKDPYYDTKTSICFFSK